MQTLDHSMTGRPVRWTTGKMRNNFRCFCIALCVAALTTPGLCQKVNVGYDKSTDFSKYKTYSWAEPAMQPARPVLYATVVDSIESELKAKGLQHINNNGDLTLIAAGGIDFAIAASAGTPVISTYSGPPPSINSTMWTGAEGGGALMGAVPDGTLELQFVDRSTNKVVWSGTVTEKLDIERKEKSLKLASKAVVKLLKKFPPKR